MNRSVSVNETPVEYAPACRRAEDGPIFRRLEEEPVFRSVAVSEPDFGDNLLSSAFRSSSVPYTKQDPFAFGGGSDKHASYLHQPYAPLQQSSLSPPHSLHQQSISPKPQPRTYSSLSHLEAPKVHASADPINNNPYATSGVQVVMGTSPRSKSAYHANAAFAQHTQSLNNDNPVQPARHAGQSRSSGNVQFDTVDRLRLRVDPGSVGAPPRPEYIEPCGHFLLPTKNFALFEFVMRCAKFLAKENIDFLFNESKCEFQCFAYKKVECIRFAVNIYRDDAKHVVEFRRRRGDCLKSIHLFHSFRSEVLELPKPTLPDIPPEFREVMCLRSAIDHDSTALVPCLIDMCRATDIECSEQGVRYLALLSTKESNVEPLLEYGVLQEVLENVHAPSSSDTRRCAATCTANLIPEQDEAYPQATIQTLLKSACIPSLANLVLAADCPEVQREGARALYGVLHALRDSRPVDFDFLTGTMSAVLDKLNACDDETTLKYHRKLLSLVGSMEF